MEHFGLDYFEGLRLFHLAVCGVLFGGVFSRRFSKGFEDRLLFSGTGIHLLRIVNRLSFVKLDD